MTPYGYPPDQYHCLIDEQPYYLAPSRLVGDLHEWPLVVNPKCWFAWHGPPPPHMSGLLRLAQGFVSSEWMVWVEDPGTQTFWPYWIGSEYSTYLQNAIPGEPLTTDTPLYALQVLNAAGILVSPDHVQSRRRQWLEQLVMYERAFERGYVLVSGLVPAFHLGALRRYFRYHIRAGSFPLGDAQVARRYVAHDEPVARFIHEQLTPATSDIAGRLVKPSYCYLAGYESGS